MKRELAMAILGVAFSSTVFAQGGTKSPYSQFGLGQLSEQTSGFNRGMGGLGIAFRESNQVNFLNPASYSAVDSLSFIFDMGLSAQITNYKENGVSKNIKDGNFEYMVATFRMFPHVGMSFGVVPFTNIGYSYSDQDYVDATKTTYYTNSYSGSGGIHQAYVGLGAQLFKGFSIGANVSYLWGDLNRSVSNSYPSDAYINSLTKNYTATINSYRIDLGAQYSQKIGKDNLLTLGATYGLKHKLGAEAKCSVTSTNAQTSVSSSTDYVIDNGFELPAMIGAGFSFNHRNQWQVGADYSLQQWGDVAFPVCQTVGGKTSYVLDNNYFDNRHKAVVGGEWCKNPLGRHFLDRVRVRAGISYATSYYKVNGQDGPHELSVSAGFGIPFSNAINSYMVRPVLNISGQWVQQSAPGLLRENSFRINIGLTFNERWFAKWKVD